jgi:hypothetical protein
VGVCAAARERLAAKTNPAKAEKRKTKEFIDMESDFSKGTFHC